MKYETENKQKLKMTKKDYALLNLKICCYEGTATAETFETTIKLNGLIEEIIIIIISYYKNDYETQLIKYK